MELAVMRDVAWAPAPNRLVSTRCAPGALPVTGSHVFVLSHDHVLLGDVVGRGWSPPGGRTEPGETPEQTARRESYEEAGLTDLDLTFIGIWKLELLGDVPPGYRYPVPLTAQTVYGSHLSYPVVTAPVLTDEVTTTRWFSRGELDQLPGSWQWLPLLDAYRRDLQAAYE